MMKMLLLSLGLGTLVQLWEPVSALQNARPRLPCSAAEAALPAELANLRSIPMSRFTAFPEGVSLVDGVARFDPRLWVIQDEGEGIVSFDARKKKPKKKPADKWIYCACGGNADKGGCEMRVHAETGKIECNNNGCESNCGQHIIGTPGNLEEAEFQAPSYY